MRSILLLVMLLMYAAAEAQTIHSRDTVRPDTTLLVPIHTMPMDTPSHHKMPVIDPLQPDTIQRQDAIPTKRDF